MSKPKWRLYIVEAGEKADYEPDKTADNLKEAARIADGLRKEYDDGNYPDFAVWCVPYDPYSDKPYDDFPIWVKDMYGDVHWNRMIMGDYMPLGQRCDPDFIKEIEDYEEAHKPRHIMDLSENELTDLFSHITPGSIYLSDYANDYDVDEKEVSDWVEEFERDLMEQIRDEFPTITDRDMEEAVEVRETAQEFADYVMRYVDMPF